MTMIKNSCNMKFLKMVLILLLSMTLEIKSASIWYRGENRPYNFGYTIEGNQHRRESKDNNGQISGEYGFLTADNVYHVTVYATDENGNFKIISMKNIKLNQLPEHERSKSITSTTPQPFTVKSTPKIVDTTTITSQSQTGEPCASCRLVPKQEIETVKPSVIPFPSDDEISTIPPPFKIVSKDQNIQQKNIHENVENSSSSEASKGTTSRQNGKTDNRQPSMNEKLNSVELSRKKLQEGSHFGGQQKNQANQQINYNNNNGILYRFDYATDFQGHKEEGDQGGNKNGEYFSIGRDNIKRIVSYNANEFGFMPHIRQQQLNQNEIRDERSNQLHHHNFEWFHQPNSLLFG